MQIRPECEAAAQPTASQEAHLQKFLLSGLANSAERRRENRGVEEQGYISEIHQP